MSRTPNWMREMNDAMRAEVLGGHAEHPHNLLFPDTAPTGEPSPDSAALLGTLLQAQYDLGFAQGEYRNDAVPAEAENAAVAAARRELDAYLVSLHARLTAAERDAAPALEKPRDEGDPLPQISFEYGGRDVWHTDCPDRPHAAPMKHLKGRLPIGDGVVLYEYECTVCGVRVFGGCDRAGRQVRRAALSGDTPEHSHGETDR